MALHIGAAEVGLADADEPFVGRDLEHEFVLGRAAGVRALASRQQHEAPDVVIFMASSCCLDGRVS